MVTLTFKKLLTLTGLVAGLVLSSCSFSGTQKRVSSEFPYESKYIEVLGSKMHYVEKGEGDPILFIHGAPTSSYLWRNILPHAAPFGRAIAIDLIGMGKSGKPDLEYKFTDHVRYLEEFIKKMELKNVTLVIHDWGSALGFHYAMRNVENVKGIAFMEAMVTPMSIDDFGMMEQFMFNKFRDPVKGPEWIIEDNFFIETALPHFAGREMTEAELNIYAAPYLIEKDRKPLLMWTQELPLD